MVLVVPDIRLDWGNDGGFTDTGDNVSARIRGGVARATRGLDLVAAIKPPIAGAFTAELDNRTKDYSPDYSGSPLYGNLEPGRTIRFCRATGSDDFGRADSALSLGTADIGGAWTAHDGVWGISSSKGYSVSGSGSGTACASIDCSFADGAVEAVVNTLPATTAWRLVFRVTDKDNLFHVEATPTALTLRKRVAGVQSTVGSAYAGTISAGDTIRVEMLGSSLKVYQNATLRITGTDSSNASATRHGIGVGSAGTPGSARWTSFRYFRDLWRGVLDDLTQNADMQRQSVNLPGLGTLSKLRGRSGYSTPLYGDGTNSGGIRTDQALGYILDALGYTDTTLRVFDTGQTTLLWWWLDTEEDCFDAAIRILNSEGPGAALYEDAFGRWVFKNRFSRNLDAVSVTSQATIRDVGAEPLMSRGAVYDRGLKHVVNSCTVQCVIRQADSLGHIWDPGPSDVVLAPNEVRKFVVVDANHDPFKAAVAPVANTDFKYVNAGDAVTSAIDRTSGSSLILTLTAGSSGATLRNLVLRAQGVRSTSQLKLTNTTDGSASIAKYGSRPYTLATCGEIDRVALQSLCDAVVALWQDPRPSLQFSVDNADARIAQWGRDIGHRITMYLDQVGLAGVDMHIDQLAYETQNGGQAGKISFSAEKAGTSTNYFVLGTSTLDGPAVLGY